MTDQTPAHILAAAAQRIRQGDHRIDIALRGPLAVWLDDAAEGDEHGEHNPYALHVARAVLGQDDSPPAPRPLTQREADAMRYATAGLDPAQIARKLGATTSAVRSTLQRATRKLGARDVHHAIQIHNQPGGDQK